MYKVLTDEDIIKAATSIFGTDIAEGKDETIEVNVEFGTLTLNKTEYESNKRFYEEKEVNAVKEFSKYVTA